MLLSKMTDCIHKAIKTNHSNRIKSRNLGFDLLRISVRFCPPM